MSTIWCRQRIFKIRRTINSTYEIPSATYGIPHSPQAAYNSSSSINVVFFRVIVSSEVAIYFLLTMNSVTRAQQKPFHRCCRVIMIRIYPYFLRCTQLFNVSQHSNDTAFQEVENMSLSRVVDDGARCWLCFSSLSPALVSAPPSERSSSDQLQIQNFVNLHILSIASSSCILTDICCSNSTGTHIRTISLALRLLGMSRVQCIPCFKVLASIAFSCILVHYRPHTRINHDLACKYPEMHCSIQRLYDRSRTTFQDAKVKSCVSLGLELEGLVVRTFFSSRLNVILSPLVCQFPCLSTVVQRSSRDAARAEDHRVKRVEDPSSLRLRYGPSSLRSFIVAVGVTFVQTLSSVISWSAEGRRQRESSSCPCH